MSKKRSKTHAGQAKNKLMTHHVVLGVVAVLAVGALLYGINQRTSGSQGEPLTLANSIFYQFPDNHFHGLGYDSASEQLFLATHYGLFVVTSQAEEWQLYQLGDNRDDFMGFSLHPDDPQIVYTSGHPRSGGNIGVLKSEDGGQNFQRIFSGLFGETVDFHSMTISAADPDNLYGFFRGNLYRTQNGGQSWEFADAEGLSREGPCWGVPCLAADAHVASRLYAGTPQGIFVSDDFGDQWQALSTETGVVVGVGVHPENPQQLFAMTEQFGVAVSLDGGTTWEPRNEGLQFEQREFAFAFVFDDSNPARVFLATTGNHIYLSENGGESWQRIL